jgi:hypothetical protein
VDKRLLAEGSGPRGEHLNCSFCGRPRHEVRKLIAGPGCYLCAACVTLAEGVASSGSPAHTPLGTVRSVPEQDGLARCGFCGKYRCLVTGLVALSAETGWMSGPATVCCECLSLCDEIIAEELPD